MVDKLQIEIDLEGSAKVETQLKRLQQAFSNAGVAVSQFVETLAGVGATAAVAAGAALVKFAQAAGEVEKSLTQLQNVTGQSFENLSALQQVFAAGGTDAKSFANALEGVAKRAADVAQEIKAQQASPALVAWANDIDALTQQYEHMGEAVFGVGKRITNGLTSLDTKTKAVLNSLAKVSDPAEQWARLANILKGMSAADAARVGEKLGLSPAQISTLRQGAEILKGLQDEAKIFGLTLTASNQQALQEMVQAWNQFSSLLSAIFNKMGAAAAPAFTAMLAAANEALIGITQDFQNLPLDQAIANLGTRLGPAFQQLFNTLSPIIVQGGQALGMALIEAFANAVKGALSTIVSNFTNEVMQNIAIARENIRRMAPSQDTIIQQLQERNPAGRFAAGGLLGGRGTGTSDSNLAWVSRGEHIMPARAVAQPGVLAFLEALRRSGGNLRDVLNGMSRFALGGMVPRRAMAFAGGGMVGGAHLGTLTLGLPSGGSVNVRASADVVDQLRREAALAQVRSGGRKPSRYS